MLPPVMTHDAVRGYMQEMELKHAKREREQLAMGGEQPLRVKKQQFRFSRLVFWTRKAPLEPVESVS
jgi:hypothetical protein